MEVEENDIDQNVDPFEWPKVSWKDGYLGNAANACNPQVREQVERLQSEKRNHEEAAEKASNAGDATDRSARGS